MWLYAPIWEERTNRTACERILQHIRDGLVLPDGIQISGVVPLGEAIQSWGWVPAPTPRLLAWVKGEVMNHYQGTIYPAWDLTEPQAKVAGKQILVYDGESLTLGGPINSTGRYGDSFPFQVQRT